MKLTRSINRRTQRSFRRIEFDFPRPNIIMSGGKHEKPAEIYFEYREFKNLILPQNNLQKECGKQLFTSLLKTHNYFENYQLVVQHQKVF